MAEAPTRERFGIQFTGSVLRDGWQILRDRNADAALPFTPFFSVAGFNAIAPVGNNLPLALVTTGMMDMNASDGLEFFIGGAAAAGAGTWAAYGYDPVYGVSDTGKQIITGWAEVVLAQGAFNLNGPAIGAAGAAALVSGTGIAAGDVVSDVTTVTTTPGANVGNIELVTPAATVAAARVLVNARGHNYLRVLTAKGTATNVWVVARRLQGLAQRSRA